MSVRDDVVEIDTGSKYAVLDFGGSGPDVLLLHELVLSAEIWRPFATELAGFCHAVAVDLCGHGRTVVESESATRLAADLPRLVQALGLTRPLVIVGQEELLSLFDQQFRDLDIRGALVAFAVSPARGTEAVQRWSELMGPDALEGWVDRVALFATGPAGTEDDFVRERISEARKDWFNKGVAEEQLRSYFERQIRTTPDGWERVPTRPFFEEALHILSQGRFGLDALDLPDVPVWALVSEDVTSDDDLERFSAWAEANPQHRVESISGCLAVDSVEPHFFGAMVRGLLADTEDPSPS